MRYWLMKSEPDTYGIDHLIKEKNSTGMWEGCRNYTVRNFMRDDMSIGDMAFFYHSNVDPIGVAGTMEIVSEPYPDPTQFDPKSKYFDEKSTKDKPRWLVRDVKFVEKFPRIVSLAELKSTPGLEDMWVARKGMRLSVTPVTKKEWDIVTALAKK
jgi:predicted RNA-binding protein with PUA-like domain